MGRFGPALNLKATVITVSNLFSPQLPPVSPADTHTHTTRHLQHAGGGDGRRVAVANFPAAAARGLDRFDDPQRFLVGNLPEDDVLPIQPARDDGGDEELGPVAKRSVSAAGAAYDIVTGCTYVLGPALAIERRPGRVCFCEKFSSANFSP